MTKWRFIHKKDQTDKPAGFNKSLTFICVQIISVKWREPFPVYKFLQILPLNSVFYLHSECELTFDQLYCQVFIQRITKTKLTELNHRIM